MTYIILLVFGFICTFGGIIAAPEAEDGLTLSVCGVILIVFTIHMIIKRRLVLRRGVPVAATVYQNGMERIRKNSAGYFMICGVEDTAVKISVTRRQMQQHPINTDIVLLLYKNKYYFDNGKQAIKGKFVRI